jgi:hypothetical protein
VTRICCTEGDLARYSVLARRNEHCDIFVCSNRLGGKLGDVIDMHPLRPTPDIERPAATFREVSLNGVSLVLSR